MRYEFDHRGRYVGTTEDEGGSTTDVSPPDDNKNWVWNCVEWVRAPELMPLPITEVAAAPVEITIPPVEIAVSPVEFKLLFTSVERQKIAELRTTDGTISDLMQIVDDPRLTKVVLSLESNQNAVRYTVFKLVEQGVIEDITAEARIAEILSGVLK